MPSGRRLAEIHLVPGFMGFDHIAQLQYFDGVATFLENHLRRKGLATRIRVTRTIPAGGLAARAAELAKDLADAHVLESTSVHLIGHSTGGLDVRGLLSPGGALDPDSSGIDAIVRPALHPHHRDAIAKVRTATSLATPHYGTPAAEVLLELGLDRILAVLACLARTTPTRAAMVAFLRVAGVVTTVGDDLDLEPSLLAWMSRVVLRRDPDDLLDYLESFGTDLGALHDLRPPIVRAFAMGWRKRPEVDYVSYCTGTNPPAGPIRTDDPLIATSTRIFRRLWPAVADGAPPEGYAPADACEALRARHREDLDAGLDVGALTIDERSNDGVVPTLSQVFGRVGGVFASDHVDCIGLFRRWDNPGFIDSGASFGSARFALLWSRIADDIAAAAAP